MKFSISKNLRDDTKCKKDFSCLKGKERSFCDIYDSSAGRVHFIRPLNSDTLCSYKMTFGYSFTCNCPVRKDLYNRYGV